MFFSLTACTNPTPNRALVISKTSKKTVLSSKKPQNRLKQASTLKWQWPVQGTVVRAFVNTDHSKGIDIAGREGTLVKSACDGVVVYSGNSLKGYGNLIMVKHDDNFISVYAHNQALKVQEGEKVKRGQPIALMGNTDSQHVKLHFEIRYKGQSIDPLKFLPKT